MLPVFKLFTLKHSLCLTLNNSSFYFTSPQKRLSLTSNMIMLSRTTCTCANTIIRSASRSRNSWLMHSVYSLTLMRPLAAFPRTQTISRSSISGCLSFHWIVDSLFSVFSFLCLPSVVSSSLVGIWRLSLVFLCQGKHGHEIKSYFKLILIITFLRLTTADKWSHHRFGSSSSYLTLTDTLKWITAGLRRGYQFDL